MSSIVAVQQFDPRRNFELVLQAEKTEERKVEKKVVVDEELLLVR